MIDFIYTLTLIKDDGYTESIRRKIGKNLEKVTVGWFNTAADAERALNELLEYLPDNFKYDKATIEKVRYGVSTKNYLHWWYRYNWREKKFERIEEPEHLANNANYSINAEEVFPIKFY